jgi:hypothetical protein
MTIVAIAARRTLPVTGVSLLALLVGAELAREPGVIRLIAAACIGICAFIAAVLSPERAVLATLLLLPFLAFVRRLLLDFTEWQSIDPLLLVAPAVLGLLVVQLFLIERRELARDRTSKLMLIVIALTLVQVANPRGGGVTAGLAALLFTAIPLSWYFVGREVATPPLMRRLFGGLVVIACVVAVYGLIQTWDGLPSWDLEWVRQTGYASLHVGEVVRAFGTFSSAAEYAYYLGTAVVVSVAFALARRPYFLPAIPLFAVALFYESSRGILIATTFAVLIVLAARTGSMRRSVVVLAICLTGLVLAFTFARGFLGQRAAASSNPLVSHQLAGLADPFNEEKSTLPVHLTMFQNGLKSGLLDPFGHGIAGTTRAGSELGTGASASTEVDVSNAFISLGTVGGLAYLMLVLVVLRSALSLAVQRRDAVSMAALGTLVVVFGQWLNGGFYAVSPLIWLTAGFVVASEQATR